MVASPKQLTKLAIDSILEATIFFSFTNVGFHVRSRIFHWQNFWNKTERSLDGKTVVVTGATGGLGSEMAIAFAKAGATVWVTGRNKAGLETLKATIDAEVPGASINTYQLDLASLDAVRDFAQTLNSQLKSLDVLIHNAGALVHKFDSTEDGIEITAQVHVVAPFVLTSELLPLLNATPDSRVLTTSSGGMYTKAVTSKSLDCSEANFNGSGAYAMAKRAQIDLTKKWSQLPLAHTIHFHTMHPGWADTPGIREALPKFYRLVDRFLRTPRQGADTMVWLGIDKQALETNGNFWFDRKIRRTVILPRTRTSQADVDELWDWCCEKGKVSLGEDTQ